MMSKTTMVLTTAVAVLSALVGEAHANSNTSGNISISMAVTSTVVSVSPSGNSSSSVSLPSTAGNSQTVAAWIAANAPIPAVRGAPWFTSNAFNQTATISSQTASVPILSIVVQPASGATTASGDSAEQLLGDTATPPNNAGGGNLLMGYEQVSWNGTASPASYDSGSAPIPYSTTGTTSGATLVWRPVFSANGNTTATMGAPVGGMYTGNANIVITY